MKILLMEVYSSIPVISGLIMSLVHVISGPDHLAAVLPLAVDTRKKSWLIGLAWGIGHTLGMLIIGLIFILIKDNINIDYISGFGEKLVGFLLIAVGLWIIVKVVKKNQIHSHVHRHNGKFHTHEHQHDDTHFHIHKSTVINNILTAIGIGIIHGVAGFSHLLIILPTLTFDSNTDSYLYLAGFTAGTLVAMISFAFAAGWLSDKLSAKVSVFNKIRIISGILAILVGIWWIIVSFL
ncbi:MAG: hydantoin utilization protein A [Marinilabiliales bacterium]